MGISEPDSTANARLRGLLTLQRMAGNRAVLSLLRPVAQRWTSPFFTTKSDEELIRDGKAGDVTAIKQIRDYSAVAPEDRIAMIRLLIAGVVGPWDEKAIVELWSTFGDSLASTVAQHPDVWKSCADNPGIFSNVRDLPPVKQLGVALTADTQTIALKHLDDNEAVVRQEMQRMGIPADPGQEAPSLTADQDAEYQRMAEAAKTVAELQRDQQTARNTYVGWEHQTVTAGGNATTIALPATFSPFHPPSEFEPMGVVGPRPKLAPYAQVKAAYDRASDCINKQVVRHPLLYAIARDGDPAKTEAFTAQGSGAQAGPEKMRTELVPAVRELLHDIAKTKLAISGAAIDPLDLSPVLQQIHAGGVGAQTDWSAPLANWYFEDAAKSHKLQKALDELEFQSAALLVGLLAPFTGGASIFILFGVAAAEAGKAAGSWQDYQTLAEASKTSVLPGTQVVDQGQADDAQAKAEADTVAAALAAACALGSLAMAVMPETPAPEGTPDTAGAIGPPTKVSTGDPAGIDPRPMEWPYSNPPNMVTVEPGTPVDLQSLDPKVKYIWVVDAEGNFKYAPEVQNTSDFMKPLPKDQAFRIKHGDLQPGDNPRCRGPARAGGELVNVVYSDGSPSDIWELNNDSSYTFARVDDDGNPLPWAPAESIDAVVDHLKAGGTDANKLVTTDVLANQRPPQGK